MKTMFKNYVIFFLLFWSMVGYAQYPWMLVEDNVKTSKSRDIEVAEKILETLLNQESKFYGNNVEGIYIEGHGAMFTIYGNIISNLSFTRPIILPPSGDNEHYTLSKTTDKPLNVDSLNNALRTQTKEVMKIFITDYAQLLNELKPDDKILLRYVLRNRNDRFLSGVFATRADDLEEKEKEDKQLKEFGAEVMKSEIDDFRTGKLTKAQLEDRIKFTEQVVSTKKDTELELLGSIFHRLYQGDLSETFRLYNDPHYERIEGLGVVYEMNFGRTWGQWAQGTYEFDYTLEAYERAVIGRKGQGQNKEKSDKEETDEEKEWKEKLKNAYPKFIEEFKRNVIEYGRTVRKLPANELLIFKLDLNTCEECDIPDRVEISIKKSVLESYDSNKITM
ncbi:MAG: hypothetical protein SFU99_01330, partial [Saprospiraceae bacterium]|nr:hypothetical protein [Saprospiraceae bacterium]